MLGPSQARVAKVYCGNRHYSPARSPGAYAGIRRLPWSRGDGPGPSWAGSDCLASQDGGRLKLTARNHSQMSIQFAASRPSVRADRFPPFLTWTCTHHRCHCPLPRPCGSASSAVFALNGLAAFQEFCGTGAYDFLVVVVERASSVTLG